MRNRVVLFSLVCGLCLVLGGGYLAYAALRSEPATSDAVAVAVDDREAAAPEPAPREEGAEAPAISAAPRGRVIVRAVDRDDPRLNGQIAELTVGGGKAEPIGSTACQRVYFAAGRGVCLALKGAGVSYEARIFDARGRTLEKLGLLGIPSRARVSPDGHFGAFTSFVTGHSYAAAGAFSTRTVIVDLRSGKPFADLERFKVLRDGEQIEAPDFNFWGITFARDPNRFYATLATAGHHYLVEGDLAARSVRVLNDGVECPSLSPDGTRIAYKARIGPDNWRLQVLELATGRRTLLSETRSVDDQAEWLDGGWVAYGLGGDVWAVRSDGRGRPRRLAANASSPSAQRQ